MIKKSFGVIIKVVSVILAFQLLTLLFMPKYIEKNNDGRITAEYYREKTDIDVIFTGSSTVHAGVSPMVLYRDYGITAYDRSGSSQVMALSYYLTEEAIKRNKPELVVADVGFIYQPFDYVDEGASRKSLDGMKWSKSKSDAVKAVMDPTENYMDYVFPVLRFHSRWNDLCLEDLKYWVYKPDVTSNGQLLQFEDGGKTALYDPMMLDEGTLACDENIAYLQKMIDLCKANGVQILLMKMPFIEGNWCQSIDDQISSLAKANDVKYVNFINEFDSFGFDQNTDFSDGQHMNSFGAEKFTNALGKYITDNYSVTDRSKEAKVAAVFDKKLEKYNYAMENKISTDGIGD